MSKDDQEEIKWVVLALEHTLTDAEALQHDRKECAARLRVVAGLPAVGNGEDSLSLNLELSQG